MNIHQEHFVAIAFRRKIYARSQQKSLFIIVVLFCVRFFERLFWLFKAAHFGWYKIYTYSEFTFIYIFCFVSLFFSTFSLIVCVKSSWRCLLLLVCWCSLFLKIQKVAGDYIIVITTSQCSHRLWTEILVGSTWAYITFIVPLIIHFAHIFQFFFSYSNPNLHFSLSFVNWITNNINIKFALVEHSSLLLSCYRIVCAMINIIVCLLILLFWWFS